MHEAVLSQIKKTSQNSIDIWMLGWRESSIFHTKVTEKQVLSKDWFEVTCAEMADSQERSLQVRFSCTSTSWWSVMSDSCKENCFSIIVRLLKVVIPRLQKVSNLHTFYLK